MNLLKRVEVCDQQHVRSDDWFLSWLAVVAGLVIIACHIESGRSRWSAASLSYAVQVPGSPATWGVVILLAGCALIYGNWRARPRALWVGYWLACWWFCVLASAAAWAMIDDYFDGTRHANPLAVVFFPAFAYLYQSRVNGQRNRSR